MKTLRLIIGLLAGIVILTLLFSNKVHAQSDEGFIYGKIITIEGNNYQGQIRWGKEEAYWSDLFNASKEKNDYLKELSRDDMDKLEENRIGNSYFSNWRIEWSGQHEYIHQFSCQFGEIKSMRMTGRKTVDIKLKNGETIMVNGAGYNDIGTKIRVMDADLGEIRVDWARIDEVVFMDTPKKLDQRFGEPVYGRVETTKGSFTGFIQWDHDERVSTDRLDGDTNDGDLSIPFGKIRSIERDGGSSIVILNSGRELILRGTNDVNYENRGIIVTDESIGRIDIPWKSFNKVIFSPTKNSGKAYSSYGPPKEINGKLNTTEGNSIGGRIVFDLDESYTFELLQGKDDELEYIIPFRNIEKIVPKNYNFTEIYLKSGKKVLLGDSQDVSDRNYGILVYSGNKDPVYVPWKEVKDIRFE